MKRIPVIFAMMCFFGLILNAPTVLSQSRADSIRQANKIKTDSIRLANQQRLELLKAAQQKKRDSLAEVRNERELARKKAAKAKSKSKKNEPLEDFTQTDFSPADSARTAKLDSLKLAREKVLAEKKKLADQNKASVQAIRKKKIAPLTQEMSIGYRLASDGWGFIINRGFIHSEDEDRLHTGTIWIDLSEKHHPKESSNLNENFSVVNPSEIKPVSYKYGKINNFYQFKFGYANMKPITGKLDKKSVVIHWVYGAGISLGILKPYYLDLLVPEGNVYVRKFAKYSEQNKESFLDTKNQGTIIGGSSFTKGIGEIKLQPGLALRSGFYFDYAPTRKTFLGVEIGASAELYTKEIPIMINAKNNAVFLNIYADIRFGKRWE